MKIKRLIKRLEDIAKNYPDADVKLHGSEGEELLFVMQYAEGYSKNTNVIWFEGASDNDMSEELEERFNQASENNIDELDFFMDLFEMGITLEDINKYIPDRYEYSRSFCEEHGLI